VGINENSNKIKNKSKFSAIKNKTTLKLRAATVGTNKFPDLGEREK